MRDICLCVKIHIPQIHMFYRFFNINRSHRYYDEQLVKNHVNKISSNNILPFLETLESISSNTHGKFKAAVSLSGNTTNMLYRYNPEVIKILLRLKRKNTVEFLSESWSNSLLPFIRQQNMVRQIKLHDTIMKSMFEIIPDVFFMHSPVYSSRLSNIVFNSGKKQIVTFFNRFSESTVAGNFQNKSHFFLIHMKQSRLIQKIDYESETEPFHIFALDFYNQLKNNKSDINPLVLMYNPAHVMKSFGFGNSLIWRALINQVLDGQEFQFVFPSEMNNNNNHLEYLLNTRDEKQNPFELPDLWLMNNLQKEAFKKQLKINNKVKYVSDVAIIKEWDILQDKEYLYYMNDNFTNKEFADFHFNPFTSPYLAYINYMNILDDFMERLDRFQNKNSGKGLIFRKTIKNKTIENSTD